MTTGNQSFVSNYISSVLVKGEKVLCTGKVHWVIYLWPIVWTIFLFGPIIAAHKKDNYVLAILLVIIWIYALLKKKSIELAITNKRVIAKFGIISRKTFEIDLRKVEGVNFDQSILGRLLRYASIKVHGTGGSKSPIPKIANYLEFKKVYQDLVHVDEQKISEPI